MLSVRPSSFKGALLVRPPAGAELGWAAFKSSDRAKLGLLLRRSSSSSAACSDKEQLWHYMHHDGFLLDGCLTLKHSILIIPTGQSKTHFLIFRLLEKVFEHRPESLLGINAHTAAVRHHRCKRHSRWALWPVVSSWGKASALTAGRT